VIVFSGPPLSGKTTLSKKVAKEMRVAKEMKVKRLEMDKLRKKRLPNSDQGKRDRNAVYRMVLEKADTYLHTKENCTVVLDATYAPAEHRMGVVALTEEHGAQLFVIECRVSPNDAALPHHQAHQRRHRRHQRHHQERQATRVRIPQPREPPTPAPTPVWHHMDDMRGTINTTPPTQPRRVKPTQLLGVVPSSAARPRRICDDHALSNHPIAHGERGEAAHP
jgi:predicted kinase